MLLLSINFFNNLVKTLLIIWQLTDKRNVLFNDKRSGIFKGEGHSLGGQERPSRLLPGLVQSLDKTHEMESTKPGRRFYILIAIWQAFG